VDEGEDKRSSMVEGENAEQIDEEINTQTSIVSTSRSKNDRQQEAPLRQESTITEATPSQDLKSTLKTSENPQRCTGSDWKP